MTERVTLITGASAGIGTELARVFASHGHRLALVARRADRLEALAAEITAAGGAAPIVIPCDLVQPDSGDRIAEALAAAGLEVEYVVNNAGFGLFGAVEETSLDEARNQFETTFWGAVRLIEQVLPSMRARRSGRIINVSSVLGFMPVPFQAFYVASKHALEGYSEVLNLEVRPFGIFVSLIEPSFIRTGFFEHRQEARAPLDVYKAQRTRVSPMMRQRTDAGSDPDVVAGVILKAIGAADPAVRYPVGLNGAMLQATRSFLPAFVFDRVLRKSFALDES